MSKQSIEEAAEKYAERFKDPLASGYYNDKIVITEIGNFIDIALSDAAKEYWKEYWFEKFKLEYERLNASQFKAKEQAMKTCGVDCGCTNSCKMNDKAHEQKPVWVNGRKRMPDIDDSDYPKKYVVRVYGDDPRSGCIYIGYETAEQMMSIEKEEDGYWEWLDESAMQPQLTDENGKGNKA